MSSVGVAQASARGTLILFLGNLVSTAMVTVCIILVARLLGPEGYGIYTLALLVPGLVSLFVGFGVSSASTRFVAYSLSTGDVARATSMTRTAVVFTLLFGVALSGLNYLLAPYVLVNLLHRSTLVQYQTISSVLVLGNALAQCATSALIGWGSMIQVSVFSVLQSATKLLLQVGLILGGFGVYGAVAGHVTSYMIQGLVGVAALYLVRLKNWKSKAGHFLQDLKAMTRFGLPLFTGNIAQGIATQYSTLILAAFAANAVVGFYQAAINVTVPITVISTSVQNVLFRSFAELHGLEEDISLAFAYAVRYTSLISTPITFFLLASAAPLFDLFYGSAYAPGVALLRLAAVSYLPVALGSTVLPSFLGGVGRSKSVMAIYVAYAASLVVAATIFVAGLGLAGEGIMLALLVANVALVVSGLALSILSLGVRLSTRPLVGIFLASLVAGAAVAVIPEGGLSNLIAVALDALVYIFAYLTLVPLLSGLDGDDIVRLEISVETMGPLRWFFRAVLGYELKLLRLKGGSKP